ncbi:protein chibby homolog 2 [Pezoporus wallicus]|uniref:protein chibby homolog 2 n=1 Tax=Pezoporus wallicus TaxID=35540 RepID=UPI00254D1F9A|nr:protein chibby homolog 2 [Pezoporus wallicus]XP_061314159.1 protein chibby homolog 2 [Pezoporus flaviventris]
MSAFDLMNQSMQHAEPEVECIAPWMKVRDDMFVFVDGKWANAICCQPSFDSQKVFSKKAQHEWSLWEENRALWEENQVLRIENRMLWEENKALQCQQSQNKAGQVICSDAIQQSLQKENKPFPFFQERNTSFQLSPSNKTLQAFQEKKKVLEDFQQDDRRVHITWKDQKAITESKDASSDLQKDTGTIIVHEENKDGSSEPQKDTNTITVDEDSKDTSSDLQKNTGTITSGEEGQAPEQEHKAKKKNPTATQDKTKSAPSMHSEYEILRALQDLHKLLDIFLKVNHHIIREKQGCHILYDVDRAFQEDYNKLKLQLNAVKNTVSDIRAQMEMLEKDLIAITCPMYEEAGLNLAPEYQFGEM